MGASPSSENRPGIKTTDPLKFLGRDGTDNGLLLPTDQMTFRGIQKGQTTQ